MKVSKGGRTAGRNISSYQPKKYSSFSAFSSFSPFTKERNNTVQNSHFFLFPFSHSSLPSPSSTLFAPSSLLHFSQRNYKTKKEEREEMIENKETAAILIIAEEILNGSISDKNVPYLTKHLFSRGIKIRKIEVVTDNVKEIVEVIHRLRDEVKYIFTTGGIGPTHDDLTYEALAAAYDCPVLLHDDTKNKLAEVLKVKGSPLTPGRLRMCTLPSPPPPFHSSIHSSGPLTTTTLSPYNPDQNDDNNKSNKENRRRVIKYHQHESLWVPLVEIESQTFIFPGVPSIFQNMLNLFDPIIPKNDTKTHKINVYTKHLEGDIAAALYEAETLFSPDLSIGSYPHYRPVSSDHSTHNNNINVIQGNVRSDKDKIECVQIRICIQSPDMNKIENVIKYLKSKINDCQDHSFVPDDHPLPSKL